jgi:hypothetical protein
MNKNYTLFAAAALFALVGANINADMFDFLRPESQREVPGGAKRQTPIPGLVETDTRGGGTAVEVQPLEWLAGGTSGRPVNESAYDYYE